MKVFGRYIIFTFAVLVGVSWFFQKINKYDFYCRYFRVIEEINIRNSHVLAEQDSQLVKYEMKTAFTSTVAVFMKKISSFNISIKSKNYLQVYFPYIQAFLIEKMEKSLPFSIAPPL